MHKPTLIVASCMIALGILAYLLTGMVSVTAMITDLCRDPDPRVRPAHF